MIFFDKPAKTKSAADDSAITSPIKAAIKFPKPKILDLQIEDQSPTSLRRAKSSLVPDGAAAGDQRTAAGDQSEAGATACL